MTESVFFSNLANLFSFWFCKNFCCFCNFFSLTILSTLSPTLPVIFNISSISLFSALESFDALLIVLLSTLVFSIASESLSAVVFFAFLSLKTFSSPFFFALILNIFCRLTSYRTEKYLPAFTANMIFFRLLSVFVFVSFIVSWLSFSSS